MSDEQEAQPLSGEARRLANLKPFAKDRSANPGGHPKDLAKFAERGIDVSEAGEQTGSRIDGRGTAVCLSQFNGRPVAAQESTRVDN
jgi:hypothetical protein